MTTSRALPTYLDWSAHRVPNHIAAVEPGCGSITYGELAELSDRVCDRLIYMGIQPGDRVGIYLHKSIDALAAIFGILKAGAAYVPVDASAPIARNAYILSDCSVRVTVVEQDYAPGLQSELTAAGVAPSLFLLAGTGGGLPLHHALDQAQAHHPAPVVHAHNARPEDLAYILYTSGSTGKPKGVMLAHEAATSFVDWCSTTFGPTSADRFSSHAPFHFDLSILDIYLAIKHGATLVLVSEEVGKDPLRLADLIDEQRISIWYSTPSILTLLTQYGKLTQHDLSALRIIFFAGEVFPVKHLRALKSLVPLPAYYNLYGPTETNVCTFHPIPECVPNEQSQPFPIGKVCSYLRAKVVDEQEQSVPTGQEGELSIAGPGVMQGYWNLPDRTSKAFLVDADGQRWYKTGDIVVEDADGNYIYVGRRDRMVKKRGYRVELGEIETALYRHWAIKEAAVVALTDAEAGVRVKAFLSTHEAKRPSIIELKRFCADNLPAYMVPDLFGFQDTLPKTSTDKIDYQKLKEMA
jgi:amino acid adenylation domain-containing protein